VIQAIWVSEDIIENILVIIPPLQFRLLHIARSTQLYDGLNALFYLVFSNYLATCMKSAHTLQRGLMFPREVKMVFE